jgi:hypothetical protein
LVFHAESLKQAAQLHSKAKYAWGVDKRGLEDQVASIKAEHSEQRDLMEEEHSKHSTVVQSQWEERVAEAVHAARAEGREEGRAEERAVIQREMQAQQQQTEYLHQVIDERMRMNTLTHLHTHTHTYTHTHTHTHTDTHTHTHTRTHTHTDAHSHSHPLALGQPGARPGARRNACFGRAGNTTATPL